MQALGRRLPSVVHVSLHGSCYLSSVSLSFLMEHLKYPSLSTLELRAISDTEDGAGLLKSEVRVSKDFSPIDGQQISSLSTTFRPFQSVILVTQYSKKRLYIQQRTLGRDIRSRHNPLYFTLPIQSKETLAIFDNAHLSSVFKD